MPAGLYVHVPFCAALCPYCDFAVTVGGGAERRSAFVASLAREATLAAAEWTGGAFDTIYLGGGTPSMLTPEELARLIEATRRALPVSDYAWVSLEANPEDVSPERSRAWRALGVRTVSLGVQSLAPDELRFLGRAHTATTARTAIDTALDAGFDVVSADFIYGLPGHDVARWGRSLDAIARLGLSHLSCYQLSIHDRTRFGRLAERGQLVELGDESQADLFVLTHERLAAAGYEGYEVSNFACGPEQRSRHNTKYWTHEPYVGLGPSAHSFNGVGRRWWNERSLPAWQARLGRGERPVAGSEDLAPRDLALESIMLGLRTRDGLDLEAFAKRFGVDLAREQAAVIEALAAEGLASLPGPRLLLSLRGWAIADAIAGRLFPPAPDG